MIAATYQQGGAFSVEEIPTPVIQPDEILLRVRAASICGTDLKIIRNGHRKLSAGQKIVLGHEFVGDIAEVGSNVKGYSAGQRVGVVPNAGCGICDACIMARANYCPHYTAFGIDRDGGHTEFVRIPAKFINQGNIMLLPKSVSDLEASALEPFSCVVNGVRVSRINLGDIALIFGAGPIGLMHLMLVRISGASRVIMVSTGDERLKKARELGADVIINSKKENLKMAIDEITEGRGVDVAITACADPAAQEAALGLLAPFGRLCLFGGLSNGNEGIRFDSNAVHYRNYVVTGSTGGSAEDYRMAMKLVAGRKIDLRSVISDVFELRDLKSAYEKAQNHPMGKVALVWKK